MFGPMFGRTFPAPFDRRSGAAAVAPWYLVAGRTTYGAYAAKGAASYAASKINLAAPGTRDLADGNAPAWDSSVGWTFTAASKHYLKETTWGATSAGTLVVRCTIANTYGVPAAWIGAGEQAVKRVFDIDSGIRYFSGDAYADVFGNFRNNNHVFAVTYDAIYCDGSPAGTIAGVAETTAVRMSIGGWWPGYGPYNTMSGTVQHIACYTESLSAAEIAALSAVMAAL